jgi:aspartate kinase
MDLLWSTGEIRSVALLTLYLQKLEVLAAGLNIHETGLRFIANCKVPNNVDFMHDGIEQTLAHFPVAVVPGFFGIGKNGSIRSLGRGGSDLTAVVIADALGAAQCELIKDVPGYFTDDPNRHRAVRHLPSLTFAQALAMAKAGCSLVQTEALELAAQSGLRIVVRSLNGDERKTVVGEFEGPGTRSESGVVEEDERVAER